MRHCPFLNNFCIEAEWYTEKKLKKNSTLNSNFHCSADSEVTGTVIRGAPDSVIATEIQFIIHKDEINAPAISIKSREQ